MKLIPSLIAASAAIIALQPALSHSQSPACTAWNALPDSAITDLRVTNPLTQGIAVPTAFNSGEIYRVDFEILANGGANPSDVTYGFQQPVGGFTAGFPIVLVAPIAQNIGTVQFINGITGASTLVFTASESNGPSDVLQVQFTNFTCVVPTPDPDPIPEAPTTPSPSPATATPAPQVLQPTPVTMVVNLAPIQSFVETSAIHSAQSYSNLSTFNGLIEGIRTRLRSHHAGQFEFHHLSTPAQVLDPKNPIESIEDTNRFEIFAQGKLNQQDKDAIRSDPGFDGEMETASVGFEYFLNPDWIVGVGLTIGENEIDAREIGRGTVDGQVLNLYTSYFRDGFYGDLRYAAGQTESEVTRYAAPGISLRGDTEATFHAVTFETGKNFQLGKWVHGPVIGGDYLSGGQDGYREQGDDAFNLIIGERDYESLVSRVGWSVSRPFLWGDTPIIPQLRATWERDWINDAEVLGYRFQTSPVTFVRGDKVVGTGDRPSGTLQSEAPGEDWLSLGFSLVSYLGRHEEWNVALNYQADLLRSDYFEQFGSIRVGYSF